MKELNTSDRILKASADLFSLRGYEAVSMKEIAKEAGVSEMTVFRHFENKRNLFFTALNKQIFYPEFKRVFDSELKWDLEKDLVNISNAYQDMLTKNQNIIMMLVRQRELAEEYDKPLFSFPNELRRLLMDYFIKMKDKGLIDEEPELLSISFLSANFGMFMTFLMMSKITKNLDPKACVLHNIRIFAKGLAAGRADHEPQTDSPCGIQ